MCTIRRNLTTKLTYVDLLPLDLEEVILMGEVSLALGTKEGEYYFEKFRRSLRK